MSVIGHGAPPGQSMIAIISRRCRATRSPGRAARDARRRARARRHRPRRPHRPAIAADVVAGGLDRGDDPRSVDDRGIEAHGGALRREVDGRVADAIGAREVALDPVDAARAGHPDDRNAELCGRNRGGGRAHRCSKDTTGEYLRLPSRLGRAMACSPAFHRFRSKSALPAVASGSGSARCHRFRNGKGVRARPCYPRMDRVWSGVSTIVQRTQRKTMERVGRSPSSARRDLRPVLFAVEDDEPTLALLRDVANDAGWAARGFSQLSEFERAVAERVPDLVILDDDLPDGRGGDRARSCAAIGACAASRCSCAPPPHPMRQAEIGAWVPVVSKPFDLGEIERILDAVAARRHPPVHGAAG